MAALLVGAVVLLLLGKNPALAYGAMFRGAFGSLSGITQTLAKATPLLLVGLGVIIAFRAQVINIGGEGQLVVGALAATACSLALRELPGLLLLPITALAGAVAGGLWGLVPGLLKARLDVNEILSTVMMNAIAVQLMNYLLRGPMLDPAQVAAGTNIPQSAALPEAAWIVRLVPRTLFHAGFLLALALAAVVALLLWRTTMGGESAMQIAYSENMFNVTDAAAAIRDYASSGNKLVIAHGTQYGTSLFEVAKDFPETAFAWGTATDAGESAGLKNIFAYNAKAEEGGYINGVIAALLSKSGTIGVIGPVEAGDAKTYIDGFTAGAMATNPAASVNKIYTGSFGDTAKAAEAASTQIAAGADVLTGSAQQVVGAIGIAKEKGVPWLGTQSDQSSLAPALVVATQVYDWNSVLKDMIAKINAGTYGGTAYDLTLANGGLKIAFNAGYTGVSPEIMAAAEAAIKGISDGTIKALP